MSITNITRESLTEEISKIEEKVEYINKLKDTAVESLLQQKKMTIMGKNIEGRTTSKIDQQLEDVQRTTSAVLQEISDREAVVQDKKVSIDILQEDVERLEDEMKVIHERHTFAIEQLETQKNILRDRLRSIENMDLVISGLELNLNKAALAHQTEMDRLALKREQLLARKDLTPSELAIQLAELERIVEEKEHTYNEGMIDIKSQISGLKNSLSVGLDDLNNKRDEIEDEVRRLEEAKLNATPSELLAIEQEIAILQGQLQEVNNLISIAGLTSREKINQIMEARGLTMTPSGRICTRSGRILTMAEAREQGLLDGLDEELMRMRGITLTASGRILTATGELLSRSEAERLGFLRGIDLEAMFGAESETRSCTPSSASIMSGMSSADVHYLKQVLGPPLILALAEITSKQPRDPIHYLAHWLFKYRYNEEIDEARKKELEELIAERERLAAEALHQTAEEEAKLTLIDLLGRVDLEVQRRQIEEELRRIAIDGLAEETENEDLEYEARDTLGVYDGPTTGQQL